MTAELAVDELQSPVARRGDAAGCIVHADRGSQFRSLRTAEALNPHGISWSMCRVAPPGDNTATESFSSLLQKNVLKQRTRTPRHELFLAIVVWIERKFHHQRPQSTLGGLTPIEFETKAAQPRDLAAKTEIVTPFPHQAPFTTRDLRGNADDPLRSTCPKRSTDSSAPSRSGSNRRRQNALLNGDDLEKVEHHP